MRIGVGFIVLVMMLPVTIALFGFNKTQVEQSLCMPTTELGAAPAGNVSLSAADANDTLFQAIAQVANGNSHLQLSMLVGSYLESGWNSHAVGAGSYGAFQIQDPGVVHPDITVDQALDPAYATNYMAPAYQSALKTVSDGLWASDPAHAAEEVAYHAERPRVEYYVNQGWSKVREAYRKSLTAAGQNNGTSVNTGIGSATTVAYTSSDPDAVQLCNAQAEMASKTSVAINWALSQVGSNYTWGNPPDGAGFVAMAYQQAGITLPTNLKDLANWAGDPSANLTSTWIPASQIESGEASLQAGDIPFWSDGQKDPTRDNVTRTGLALGTGDTIPNTGGGTSFKVATWNLETGSGYQSRVDRAATLIPQSGLDIVGFQEIEHPQIYRALVSAFKGSKYAIYPSHPAAVYRNSLAARSILYNTDRFELLPQTDEIQYNRMDDPQQPAHAPVIRLRDKATGQVIIVANTHSPAYARYAKQRYEAGLTYVQKLQQLTSEGLPIIFTGDFNSGYWLRTSGNTTYQNDRKNLTYCQLTANGLMNDARDVAKGLSGQCPSQKGSGSNTVDHIYVSPGVDVSQTSEIQNTLSDHNAIVADVSVPAGASSSNVVSDDASLKIATYNVLGSSHTAKSGPKSGPERIKKAVQLITSNHLAVVGLQEFEGNQRRQLLKMLGSQYQIYPRSANYGSKGIWSVNSIIWDTSQVQFVKGSQLPMPYYFGGAHKDIPLVLLKQLSSGKSFYVANTHDPAHNEYARLRYLDATQHASDMAKLVAQGTPVFFTGDFNSGYAVSRGDNPTWQGARSNLTWCIMTGPGEMHDGYDALKGRTGACPIATSKELGTGRIDHVFVSDGIAVRGYHVIDHDTGSDHPVVYIDAALGATSGGGASNQYVGPNPAQDNKIDVMPVKQQYFAGVLRISLTNWTGEVDTVLANSADQGGPWQKPLHASYTITDGYGWSNSSIRGYSFHDGVDLGVPTGTPVYAAHSGTIYKAGYGSASGNQIIIDNDGAMGTGFGTKYEHLSGFAPGISVGAQVTAGQLIGYSGQTGSATGPHLHFSVCTDTGRCVLGSGAKGTATVNPIAFMAGKGIKL